jgi:hypothetical protein
VEIEDQKNKNDLSSTVLSKLLEKKDQSSLTDLYDVARYIDYVTDDMVVIKQT